MATEQERAGLVEQAALELGGRFALGRGREHYRSLAALLVDAGWRPPPSGDVRERAVHLLVEARKGRHVNTSDGVERGQMAALADAGLLRTTQDQSDEPMMPPETLRERMAADSRLWKRAFAVPSPPSPLAPAETIAFAETVERVAKAMYAAGYLKGDDTYRYVRLVSPYLGETHETEVEAEAHATEELTHLDAWVFEVRPIRHLGVITDG